MTILCRLLLRIAIFGMMAPLAMAQTSPTASIRGIIRSGSTGAPNSGATVELQRVDGTAPQTYTTSAESDGTFLIRNIRPGEYRLVASGTGLLRSEYGQRRIGGTGVVLNLAAGQIIDNIQISMVPASVISGRILNSQGDSMVAAEVRVLMPSYQNGQRTLKIVQSAFTNDLGEYRLFGLTPGQYFLSASPSDGSTAFRLTVPRPAGLSPNRIYLPGDPGNINLPPGTQNLPTYYPGTSDVRMAELIEVRTGSNRTGIDLIVAPVKTHRVKGRVSGGDALVSLAQIESIVGTEGSDLPREVSSVAGSFDFDGVAPGQYMLTARSADLSSSQRIDVRDADLDGITLSLNSGIVVSAHATIDDRASVDSDPDFYSLYFNLAPSPLIAGIQENRYRPDPNGSFDFTVIAGEAYRLTLFPGANAAPQFRNAYIKSIHMGAHDVLTEELRFNAQPDTKIEIVIGTKPGTLSGNVLDDKRQPSINTTVVLVPDPSRRRRADAYRTATTDVSGRFQLSSIPPGDYTIFAWDDVDSGAWQDPDFIRRYEPQGTVVQINEGSKAAVSVTVIPFN